MKLREKFEKETGDSVMAYRQDYSGQTPYEDGFSDEYVEWLESKIKNSSSCIVSKQRELLIGFKQWEIDNDIKNLFPEQLADWYLEDYN